MKIYRVQELHFSTDCREIYRGHHLQNHLDIELQARLVSFSVYNDKVKIDVSLSLLLLC